MELSARRRGGKLLDTVVEKLVRQCGSGERAQLLDGDSAAAREALEAADACEQHPTVLKTLGQRSMVLSDALTYAAIMSNINLHLMSEGPGQPALCVSRWAKFDAANNEPDNMPCLGPLASDAN